MKIKVTQFNQQPILIEVGNEEVVGLLVEAFRALMKEKKELDLADDLITGAIRHRGLAK